MICALAADGLNPTGIRRVPQMQEETSRLQAELAPPPGPAGWPQPGGQRAPDGQIILQSRGPAAWRPSRAPADNSTAQAA